MSGALQRGVERLREFLRLAARAGRVASHARGRPAGGLWVTFVGGVAEKSGPSLALNVRVNRDRLFGVRICGPFWAKKGHVSR